MYPTFGARLQDPQELGVWNFLFHQDKQSTFFYFTSPKKKMSGILGPREGNFS